MNEPIEKLIPPFKSFLDILDFMEAKVDPSGMTYISQAEIGKRVGLSSTNISRKIKQLIKFGAIKQISPGVYKVLHNDLWHTPYRVTHEVFIVVSENPEVIGRFKEQAEILNLHITEVYQAWGYINSMNEIY